MTDLLFSIDVQHNGGTTCVCPLGEVDIATVPQFDEAIRAAAATGDDLVIDLRGVTFMDSTGLRTLVQAGVAAQTGGFGLSIIRGAAVARILEISGLGDLLPLVDPPA
jgi:anti-anti-sigma factor